MPIRTNHIEEFRRLLIVSLCLLGCGSSADAVFAGGKVQIDGSSTVAPITMAAAEMFAAEQPRTRVPVGVSGTGGGFKKFLADREDLLTDINGASRPIKPTEIERAKLLGIEYIELPVAIDGMAVVVNPSNDFCDHLTTEELKRIWEPGSKITSWRQVRAGFPDMPLHLFGPGTDSGTFDYFTETIMGKEKACRSDFSASESDNALVQGVAGDKGALGYFGFSYYEANKGKLKLLGIAPQGAEPVKPSLETIRKGLYSPLSRPLLIYVNRKAADRPEVQAFVHFLLSNGRKIVEHPKVNYVALSDEVYELAKAHFDQRIVGSLMASHSHEKVDLAELYGKGGR